MADLRLRAAPDPAAHDAMAASLAAVGRVEGSDEVVVAPPSCRTPYSPPDEAPWRRRLRVARSWWCAFVSGLG